MTGAETAFIGVATALTEATAIGAVLTTTGWTYACTTGATIFFSKTLTGLTTGATYFTTCCLIVSETT